MNNCPHCGYKKFKVNALPIIIEGALKFYKNICRKCEKESYYFIEKGIQVKDIVHGNSNPE